MRLLAAPDLFAAVVAAAPARVVKRLDADRSIARRWTWSASDSGGTVITDGGETVTLVAAAGLVASASDVACSCLLSPRCFHVLAAVAALEIADPSPARPATEAAPPSTLVSADVGAAAKQVAARATSVAADVLASGARGTGAVLEAELLRVVHAARIEGLHRLASAGLRVVRDVRDLRSDDASFAVAALVADLHDLLATGVLLGRPSVAPSIVGVARRAYEPVGSLRLYGVCTEPVVARGGMAGVVTHLIDEHGGLWSIGDVQRGDVGRAIGAYDAAIAMGDTTTTHRTLARSGLIVQDATASEDRRLGAGKQVKAVRAQAELGWTAEPIRARFTEPLRAQVERAYTARALADAARPRGATLLFVRATVMGWDDGAVWVRADDGPLRVIAPSSHAGLGYVDNLRMLAGTEGLPIDVVGHLVFDAPRTMSAVAFGPGAPVAGAPALSLPEAWRGLAVAGLDTVVGAHFIGTRWDAQRVDAPEAAADPLVALRRRIERAALHGLRSLPPEATATLDGERASLERHTMNHASRVLGALVGAARIGRGPFAEAWLAAASYATAATTVLWRDRWSP
jgi:hypothetical protein